MAEPDLLATLNCSAGVMTPDSLSRHLRFLKESLRERTRLLSANSYGIVDSADPKYNDSASAKALWPVLNPGDYSKVTVYPGRAVTPGGDVVKLENVVTVQLAGLTRNSESLILIQYTEVASDELALTLDGQTMNVGDVVKPVVMSMTLQDYYDATLTTRDMLDRSVVIGVVIWSDTDIPLLVTDNSNGYSWNRPWFSAADVMHRSMIGSGTVTETNPHGTGLNDLSVGRLKLYDHLTNSGMILSKALSVPGVPGYLCQDVIATTSIKLDTNGEVTKTSWFSHPGCFYVELSAIPNIIYRAYTDSQEYAIDWIKGTRFVLIITSERPTSSLTIVYSRTLTGSVQKSDNTSVTFNGVDNLDIVITDGIAKTSILRTNVPVRRYGDVPREMSFHVGSNGQVYVDPTMVMPFAEVNQNANVVNEIDVRIPAPGRVGIALTDMPNNPASTVSFKISGFDVDGNAINEILVFDNANWVDVSVPAEFEEPRQVHFTNKIFASVESVIVLDTIEYSLDNIGSARFAVLVKQDATYSKTARLATAFWDGTKLTNVVDDRRVLTVVRDGKHGYTSLHQASEIMPGIDNVLGVGPRAQLIVAEDFEQPNIIAGDTVEWDGRGELNVPVIDPNVSNSNHIVRCYRSRQIGLKVNPAEWTKIVVVLFNADSRISKYGAVRMVLQRANGSRGEAVLKAFDDDQTGSIFVGFVSASWESVGFVISGHCRGFAAYFVRPELNIADYYVDVI